MPLWIYWVIPHQPSSFFAISILSRFRCCCPRWMGLLLSFSQGTGAYFAAFCEDFVNQSTQSLDRALSFERSCPKIPTSTSIASCNRGLFRPSLRKNGLGNAKALSSYCIWFSPSRGWAADLGSPLIWDACRCTSWTFGPNSFLHETNHRWGPAQMPWHSSSGMTRNGNFLSERLGLWPYSDNHFLCIILHVS